MKWPCKNIHHSSHGWKPDGEEWTEQELPSERLECTGERERNVKTQRER
jgi:hypothetical protein